LDDKILTDVYHELIQAKAVLRDYISVETFGNKYIDWVSKHEDIFITAYAHLNYGLILQGIGKLPAALEQLNRAIRLGKDLLNRLGEENVQPANNILFQCYTNKCSHYCEIGDTLKAKSYAEKAWASYNTLTEKKHSAVGVLGYCSAFIEVMESNFDKAEQYLGDAKAFFTNLHQHQLLAESYELEARIQLLRNKKEEAYTLIQAAHDALQNVPENEKKGHVLKRLADECREIGRFERAQDLYMELRDLAGRHHFRELELDALHCLEVRFFASIVLGKRNEINHLLEECTQTFNDEEDTEHEVIMLHKVADIYFVLNDLSKAFDIYTRILSVYEQRKDFFRTTQVLVSMGDIQMLQENFDGSIESFEAACRHVKGTSFYDLNTLANLYYCSLLVYLAERRNSKAYLYTAESCLNIVRTLIKDHNIAYREKDLQGLEQLFNKAKEKLDSKEL
jgi:tetratricopeptide (TPR) repeat protein